MTHGQRGTEPVTGPLIILPESKFELLGLSSQHRAKIGKYIVTIDMIKHEGDLFTFPTGFSIVGPRCTLMQP